MDKGLINQREQLRKAVPLRLDGGSDHLRRRLRQWQQVRSWARLIREVQKLWHVDERELRRLGALELSQLLQEVPPTYRARVNRWLDKYDVVIRLREKN